MPGATAQSAGPLADGRAATSQPVEKSQPDGEIFLALWPCDLLWG